MIVGFVLGLFIGACVGFLFAAMLQLAARCDEEAR